MVNSSVISKWLLGGLVLTVCTSALVLSAQRVFLHKFRNDAHSSSHVNYKRDPFIPVIDDSNRLTRLTFNTLIIVLFSVSNLYNSMEPENWFITIFTLVQLITWLYVFVLVLVSRQYQFPNRWGWILNIHLCVIYSTLCGVCHYNLYNDYVSKSMDTWLYILPDIIVFILSLDLVYITGTTPQGSPFIDQDGKKVSADNAVSIFGYLYFSWLTPLVHLAYRQQQLTEGDLPILPSMLRSQDNYDAFSLTRGKSLLTRIFSANKIELSIQLALSILNAFIYYAPSLSVNQLLLVIQNLHGNDDEELLRKGYVIVICLSFAVFTYGILLGQINYYSLSVVRLRINTMLNMEIYRKTLRHHDITVVGSNNNSQEDDKKNRDNSSIGRIVNLMSVDSSRVSKFSIWWFTVFSIPTEITVGIYFLYTLLGKSCFVGLFIMVIVLPLSHYNAKLFKKTQERLLMAIDRRISLMNELLQGIRQIKFFAWEKKWQSRIMEARDAELHELAEAYISSVRYHFLWLGSPLLITLVSFWSFTKLEGKELTAPIAFTAIGVFSELRFALNALPEIIIHGYQALTSVRRIDDYLNENEVEFLDISRENCIDNKIGFKDATVGWSIPDYKDDDNNSSNFFLKDLNIEFPKNELSLICGATGSGKTLMMLSLLGETAIIKGSIHCPRQMITDDNHHILKEINLKDWLLPHSVAYVSQSAWLQNASIRDNILFGLPFIKARYNETLFACALYKDLEIFEDGDLTEIGEKGITLSGGQKARVSLARAVYSRAQNVFMDDVLSAVDAHTAKHLYEKCIMGSLMKNRTRILITHHINTCLNGSGYLVYLKDGYADFVGSPKELKQSTIITSIIENEQYSSFEIEDESTTLEDTSNNILPFIIHSEQAERKPCVLVEKEKRDTGSVKFKHYKLYIQSLGVIAFSFLVILILTHRGLEVAESWWIKQWSRSYETRQNEHDDKSTDYYFNIYCLIILSTTIMSTARFSLVYWRALRANRELYVQLLNRILRAPLRFFDTTPIGRILNRFSNDFESIDSSIPYDLLFFIGLCISIISSIISVSIVVPLFSIPMLAIAAINIYLAKMFIFVSRELKRMESVTRSPLFSNFTETIIGITTIRAFGVTGQFFQKMLSFVEDNISPTFYIWTVDRWISVRFAASGALINLIMGLIILFNINLIDASLAGFCLSFVVTFTNQMFQGIRRYTELEKNFNAIERVAEFLEIDQEAAEITDTRPLSEWPNNGKIEVSDLQVRYAANLDPVLKDISFSVQPQEKIGIVGRTGSGKSTLALSFFRFIEASKGSIVIDDIDIKELGTEDLRSNMTIIPQDPTLFSGTLRSNLDPFNDFSNEEILTALRRVQLVQSDNNNFKNLDTVVTEGGKNFSQGQRQLICLARAILKRNRIVFMDEATASVDFETDRVIQKTLSTEFNDATILCIAHRLHTVIEYDRILVIDQGKIVEFDNTLTLLNNVKSEFYKMCRNSGEFDNLMALAKLKFGSSILEAVE